MKAVLGYGGEVWGLKDWEELERIHLLACNHILNVNTNVTTDVIYAELARNPLLKCDKLSKKAYNLLVLLLLYYYILLLYYIIIIILLLYYILYYY